MRLFVAAEIPSEVRARLGALLDELRGVPLPVRWVRPEGIHLTFKFLGETPAGRLDEIRRALKERVPGGLAPFPLEACGVGVFPERGAPRVIWVGVAGDLASAARLQASLEEAMAAIGFAREARPFKAHLTLGRVNGAGRGGWRPFLARFAEAKVGAFEVGEVVLFESRLAPGGASYHAHGAVPLGRGGPP